MRRWLVRLAAIALWAAAVAGPTAFWLRHDFGFDALSPGHWASLERAWLDGWRIAGVRQWIFVLSMPAAILIFVAGLLVPALWRGPVDGYRRWCWRRSAERDRFFGRLPEMPPPRPRPTPKKPPEPTPHTAKAHSPRAAAPAQKKPAAAPPAPPPSVAPAAASGRPASVPAKGEPPPETARAPSHSGKTPTEPIDVVRGRFLGGGYRVLCDVVVDSAPGGSADLIAVGGKDLYVVAVDDAGGNWIAADLAANPGASKWFDHYEGSERESPVARAADLRARLRNTHGASLEKLGVHTIHAVAVITRGCVMNAKEQQEGWKDFDVYVYRAGAADEDPELPEFGIPDSDAPRADAVAYLASSSQAAASGRRRANARG